MTTRTQRTNRIRRRMPVRFGVNAPLTASGFTTNISPRGLAVTATNLPAPGTRIFVELRTSDDETVQLEGRVVWARRGNYALQLPSLFGVALTAAEESFLSVFRGDPAVTVDDLPRTQQPARPVAIQRLARYELAVPIAYGTGANLGQFGQIQNISATGFAFRGANALPAGTRIFFSVRLKTGEVVRGDGQVMWTRDSLREPEHGVKLSVIDESWYRLVYELSR